MEEFKKSIQEHLQGIKVTELVFVNCETPIFVLLPNNVLIASQGAIRDMLTDKNLLKTMCSYESAAVALKSQFKALGATENLVLLRANLSHSLGMDSGAGVTQTIKNLYYSSYSTLELIDAVTSAPNFSTNVPESLNRKNSGRQRKPAAN